MSSIADVVNGKLNISESSQETERKVAIASDANEVSGSIGTDG